MVGRTIILDTPIANKQMARLKNSLIKLRVASNIIRDNGTVSSLSPRALAKDRTQRLNREGR
jgi:hypothetical protein